MVVIVTEGHDKADCVLIQDMIFITKHLWYSVQQG